MFKKIVISISSFILLAVGVQATVSIVAGQGNGPKFDLENLRNQNSNLTKAYDIIGIEDAWEAILDPSRPITTPIIGIIDTGIDARNGRHAEFIGVDFGRSSPFSLRDRAIEFRAALTSGHGTKVAGIIGANNLSATQVLPADSPQMNGILSGALNESQYVLESRTAGLVTVASFGRILDSLPQESIVNISMQQTNCLFLRIFCIKNEDFSAATAYYLEGFATHSDKVFVIGAGNNDIDADDAVPSNIHLDNTIIVGATNLNDERADFGFLKGASNFGTGVDIAAPGIDVYAPAIRGEGNFPSSGSEVNNYITNFAGTSASTPMVTGVAGLLKAINPDLTPAEIKNILVSTADPISTDKPIGPRLNALNAVCHPLVLDCPEEIAEAPWPQFQHDARHTGQSPFVGPQTSNIKWSFIPSIVPPRGGFVETPVVGPNDVIYFGAGTQSTGRLFALNPNGTLKWQSSLLRAAPTNPAIITDGMVIIVVGTQDFGTDIVAIDEDGNTLWTFPIEERVDFVTLSPDGTLYITNEKGFLFSLTPSQTGVRENWRTDLGGRIGILRSSPAVGQNGTIYVIERPGTVFRPTRIFAIAPQDGSIIWTRSLRRTKSAPSALILDDSTVVVSTQSGLRGFNPIDGTDVFTVFYDAFGFPTAAPILLPDNNIGVVVKESNGNGTLHRINPNTQTIASSFPLGPVLNIRTPVVDNQGTIYIAADIVSDAEDRIANPATLFAVSNTNTLVFTKTFLILPKNLAIGSTGVLYVPVIDIVSETEVAMKMVAIGE